MDLSKFQFHAVGEAAMNRLLQEHGIEQTISGCRTEETLVDQGRMHHAFCCAIKIIEYFDPTTGDPIASLVVQTFIDPSRAPVRIFKMCVIGVSVYVRTINP